MVLKLAGAGLILVGIVFAVRGIGQTEAKAQAFKMNIVGQSWLVLVGLGVGCLAFQYWREVDGGTDKAPPTEESVVTISEESFEESEPDEPYTFGDDAGLDALWVNCQNGLMQACDDLYQDSPVGSEYEYFGSTCGELFVDNPPEFCTEAPLSSVIETTP